MAEPKRHMDVPKERVLESSTGQPLRAQKKTPAKPLRAQTRNPGTKAAHAKA